MRTLDPIEKKSPEMTLGSARTVLVRGRWAQEIAMTGTQVINAKSGRLREPANPSIVWRQSLSATISCNRVPLLRWRANGV